MKHNGVVTRILKTSSATSATSAGSAKARPIAPVIGSARSPDRDADDILSKMGDLDHASPTPVFVQNMEREIEEILSGKGTKLSFEASRHAGGETPTKEVPAPSEEAFATAPEKVERETVRAPGTKSDPAPANGHVHVPPPPRPPPLPSEMRDAASTHEAVTMREGRPQSPPPPPARPEPKRPEARRPELRRAEPRRGELVPVKAQMEPVRVQVKPPPLPLPLGPRRDGQTPDFHASPETRREPSARNRQEPNVEFWTDTSLVESIPPSDPNSVLPARGKSPSAEYAQAIVLYGTAHEAPAQRPAPPALPAPQDKAPPAATPQPKPSPPPTAWVQQPSPPAPKPMRARLQAAALGIAAGIAISMVLTWRPETSSSGSTPAVQPQGNAAVMLPVPAKPETTATAAPATSAQPVIQPTVQLTGKLLGKIPPKAAQPEAKPQTDAAPVTAHGPKPPAQGPAAAPSPKPSSSGRIAGDDE